MGMLKCCSRMCGCLVYLVCTETMSKVVLHLCLAELTAQDTRKVVSICGARRRDSGRKLMTIGRISRDKTCGNLERMALHFRDGKQVILQLVFVVASDVLPSAYHVLQVHVDSSDTYIGYSIIPYSRSRYHITLARTTEPQAVVCAHDL